jgi:hypothetical protein
MRSTKPGTAISSAEVVHASAHGFWLHLRPHAREVFLAFRTFPWFADATIRELSTIEVERGRLLRWPALDVDLDLERIEHPERYPLVARRRRARRARVAGETRQTSR